MNLERRIDRLEEMGQTAKPTITKVIIRGEPIPPDADTVIEVINQESKALVERVMAGERTETERPEANL